MKKLLLTVVACLAVYGLAIAAVNINTATKEEFLSLKGVGEKRAEEIINYRTKNGPFKTVDDLGKVPGIGPGLMKQIRNDITIRQAGDRQTRRGFNKNSAENRRFHEVREGYGRQALDGEIESGKIARSRIRLLSRQVDFARRVWESGQSLCPPSTIPAPRDLYRSLLLGHHGPVVRRCDPVQGPIETRANNLRSPPIALSWESPSRPLPDLLPP
jgi:competence protein ComEA